MWTVVRTNMGETTFSSKAPSATVEQIRARASVEGYFVFTTDPREQTLALARRLGALHPHTISRPVFRLKPTSQDSARPNSMSTVVGLAAQPPHTDCAYLSEPPRWVLLRSSQSDATKTPTLIWDVRSIIKSQAPSAFGGGLWLIKTGKRSYYTAILSLLREGAYRLRYDPCCMSPANEEARRESRMLDDYFKKQHPAQIFWQHGLCLLIDNFTSVHARARVCRGSSLKRELERCYLA